MRPTYLIETVWIHSPLPDYPVLPGTHPAHAWSRWSVRGMGLPPMRRTVLESNDFNAFSRVRPFAAFPVRAFVTLVDEHFFLLSLTTLRYRRFSVTSQDMTSYWSFVFHDQFDYSFNRRHIKVLGLAVIVSGLKNATVQLLGRGAKSQLITIWRYIFDF